MTGPPVGMHPPMTQTSGGRPDGPSEDLVEPEGVNAGSDVPEDASTGRGDPSGGGAAAQAPQPAAESATPDQLAGVPDQESPGSGQQLSVGEG
jgi:hypothetical protein